MTVAGAGKQFQKEVGVGLVEGPQSLGDDLERLLAVAAHGGNGLGLGGLGEGSDDMVTVR